MGQVSFLVNSETCYVYKGLHIHLAFARAHLFPSPRRPKNATLFLESFGGHIAAFSAQENKPQGRYRLYTQCQNYHKERKNSAPPDPEALLCQQAPVPKAILLHFFVRMEPRQKLSTSLFLVGNLQVRVC